MEKNEFTIVVDKFYQGLAPAWFKGSYSEFGNAGHGKAMTDADVLNPTFITQGAGLAALTNGTQAAAITDQVNYILDMAVASNATYAISATKLHQLSATTVTNSGGTFPHTITNATDGESIAYLLGNLYYFYNKSSGADIGKFDLSSTFDDDWGSTTPTGAAALQKDIHPVAVKEDLMVFGNGRYVGYYDGTANVIDVTKLDFGTNSVVTDVWFHQNKWWIAVSKPNLSGANRSISQIYLWDGAATSSLLQDEIAVGVQRIGFGMVVDGIVYIAYEDLSTSSYKIGYVSGSRIMPLGTFTGALPNFAQKTLYNNTILFVSSGGIWSCGSLVPDLPIQISQITDGGYTTVGALASPFGTPLVASTQSTSFQLAKFSGYNTSANWTSITIPLVNGRMMGVIDDIVVLTNHLGANARVDVTLKYNQAQSNSGAKQVSTASKRRHGFSIKSGLIEDVEVYLDWSNGNATNNAAVRAVHLIGHWAEGAIK